MNTILILGSEGFIGKNLIIFYLKKGWEVTGVDLCDSPTMNYEYIKLNSPGNDWNNWFPSKKFQFCINAAGSGNVSYSVINPKEDFKANCYDSLEILELLRKYQPQCKYVHISSAAVYGNPAILPVNEDFYCKPLSPYGYHKWVAEILCKEYNHLFGLPVSIVRPFSVYGPGLCKQLFWDLYQKYLTNPNTIEVWGTGNESRDFIFIDDLVYAINCVVEKSEFTAEIFNLGSGTELTIKQAVNYFFESLDKKVSVSFNGMSKQGDPMNWCASITKIKSLGFRISCDFKDGIKKTADWYKNQN